MLPAKQLLPTPLPKCFHKPLDNANKEQKEITLLLASEIPAGEKSQSKMAVRQTLELLYLM